MATGLTEAEADERVRELCAGVFELYAKGREPAERKPNRTAKLRKTSRRGTVRKPKSKVTTAGEQLLVAEIRRRHKARLGQDYTDTVAVTGIEASKQLWAYLIIQVSNEHEKAEDDKRTAAGFSEPAKRFRGTRRRKAGEPSSVREAGARGKKAGKKTG